MKTYCNARLSLLSPAHNMTQKQRSGHINDWLKRHDNEAVIEKSRRGKSGVNNGASLSVAFSLEPKQAARLDHLLDGRKYTLSGLVRHIFEEQS